MKIPKSFDVLGHRINVLLTPHLRVTEGNLGEADYVRNIISLQNSTSEFQMSRDTIEHTYLHEMVHFILYYMGNELYEDEQFVDMFSGLLHQALKSQQGEHKV